MPRKGQDMFCSTATTVAILQNAWSGHSPDTPEPTGSLGERGGMMSDDVILRRSPYPASQCFLPGIAVFFTRKVNVKGGLTGGCAHCVITTTFASVGSLQPVKGALRRYAPLTGFHSKGRSHWSLASPSCPLNMATIRRCTSPSTLTNVLLTNAA